MGIELKTMDSSWKKKWTDIREDEGSRWCIVLCRIVLYCVVLYCIALYCIVLYCIVLYCIVLYCIVFFVFVERVHIRMFVCTVSTNTFFFVAVVCGIINLNVVD